jgi:hypothetical protein
LSARYTAMVSDELTTAWDTSLLPEGLRVSGITECGPDPAYVHYRIVTFDDDDAPEELTGKRVNLTFRIQPDGKVVIAGRDVVA